MTSGKPSCLLGMAYGSEHLLYSFFPLLTPQLEVTVLPQQLLLWMLTKKL